MIKIQSCSDNITDHNATTACFEYDMLLPEWPHAGPYPAPCFGSFGIQRRLKQLVFIRNYIVQGQYRGSRLVQKKAETMMVPRGFAQPAGILT